ncbi:hypothetical protein [Alkalihalobacillus sp. BA299]|uniref:hypothetical protein n=1 Tax=Alkalihalobacillus sp. BA299 TaxID=2815938 RepID=UPI001ADB4881|nr:hypothetical protein [Alkalihalobacillus sp. BA299]
MYAASLQGIYPFAPADQRYHFYPNQSPSWHNVTMYKGSFGHHPTAYPEYLNYGHFQPSTNYGYGYATHPQLGVHHDYFDEYDNKHVQYVKAKPATKKHHPAPIHHHEYHWHHGYPFGQGSGLFPNYYHSNY